MGSIAFKSFYESSIRANTSLSRLPNHNGVFLVIKKDPKDATASTILKNSFLHVGVGRTRKASRDVRPKVLRHLIYETAASITWRRSEGRDKPCPLVLGKLDVAHNTFLLPFFMSSTHLRYVGDKGQPVWSLCGKPGTYMLADCARLDGNRTRTEQPSGLRL